MACPKYPGCVVSETTNNSNTTQHNKMNITTKVTDLETRLALRALAVKHRVPTSPVDGTAVHAHHVSTAPWVIWDFREEGGFGFVGTKEPDCKQVSLEEFRAALKKGPGKSVKLNDDYTGWVTYGGDILAGCQVVPKARFLALVKLWKKVTGLKI